jgi:hypothetical protein
MEGRHISGDIMDFDAFYRENRRDLLRRAHRCLGDWELAIRVTQQALLILHDRWQASLLEDPPQRFVQRQILLLAWRCDGEAPVH